MRVAALQIPQDIFSQADARRLEARVGHPVVQGRATVHRKGAVAGGDVLMGISAGAGRA
jgi:hypothetical protein